MVAAKQSERRPGSPHNLGYHHHPRFSQQNATRRKLLKSLPPVRRGPQSALTVAVRELGSGAKQGREEQRRHWPPLSCVERLPLCDGGRPFACW